MISLPSVQDAQRLGAVLADTIATAPTLVRLGSVAFATRLQAATERIGEAAGVRAVALYRARRRRGADSRWRAVTEWMLPGAAPATLPDARWTPLADASRIDAATIGMIGRRRAVTLATEILRYRSELRVCVYLCLAGRRRAVLVFATAGDRVPTSVERLAFAEASRVLGGLLQEHLRAARRRRERARRSEVTRLQNRVVELERRESEARGLQVEAQEQASELARANEVMRAAIARLVRADDLQRFLSDMLRETLRVADAQGGAIVLLRPDGVDHVLLLGRGGFMPRDEMHRRSLAFLPYDDFTNSLIDRLERDETVVIDDVETGSGPFAQFHRDERTNCVRLVPMRASHSLVGWIGLGFAEPQPRIAQRPTMLRVLANQMTLAVELTRLAADARDAAVARERERAAAFQATELAQANAALTRSGARLTDLDHLDGFLGSVVDELTRAVGAVMGCVYLHDPDTDLVSTRIVIARGSRIDPRTEPLTAPFVQPFAATGHPIWESLRRHEVHWFDPTRGPDGLSGRFNEWHATPRRSFAAAVPMLHGDTPIGFVGLGFDAAAAAPSEQRVELCRSLAQHAALAIRLDELADRARDAAVLDERTRLARDVHDTLAQGLTAIVLQLQASEGEVPPSERVRYVGQAIEIARRSLLDARRAVYALRQEHADGADLGTALDASVKLLFARSATRVRMEIEGVRRRLEPAVEDELLRIGQEAATNALKYAAAAEFGVHLRFGDDGVVLTLSDDGRGFVPGEPTEGFGIRGMRERAARLGAAFDLHAAPGEGTVVTVTCSVGVPASAVARA